MFSYSILKASDLSFARSLKSAIKILFGLGSCLLTKVKDKKSL